MKSEKKVAVFLIFLLLFYNAQGYLYPPGTIVSQTILVVIILISLVYFIKTIALKKKEFFVNTWVFFFMLNIVGFIFSGNYNNSLHMSMLQGVICTLSIFFPFYYLTRKNIIQVNNLLWYAVLMLPLYVLQFYFLNAREVYNLNRDAVVNNVSYSFVGLIPYASLFRNKKGYAISFIAIILYFILMSSKRGAIISGTIGFSLFIYNQLKNIDSTNRFRTTFMLLIGMAFLSFFAYNIFTSNDLLLQRIQEMKDGQSSGRDVIFTNLINAWYNSNNIFNLLLGYGFASSLELSGTGNFAHNDFLETLSNFGLVGIISYLLIFYAALRLIVKSEWNNEKKIIMFSVVAIWLSNSITTPGYNSNDNIGLTIMMAFLVGARGNDLPQKTQYKNTV